MFLLFSSNEIADSALQKFYSDSRLFSDDSLIGQYLSVNTEVFSLISGLPLEKLFISVTSSESIFYRFKLFGWVYEFMWEVFLDYDGDKNIGSTLQIYNDSTKVKSTYGSISYIYDSVIDISFNNPYNLGFDHSPEGSFELVIEKYV
jgi:hypothetical protein